MIGGVMPFEARLDEALVGAMPAPPSSTDKSLKAYMCGPDELFVYGKDTRSFYWNTDVGLLVNKHPGENHDKWIRWDKEFAAAYDEISSEDERCVMGRYGKLHDELVVAVWYEPRYLTACLRELTRYIGVEFIVAVADAGNIFRFPPRHGAKSRGHQYWQSRQTSESKTMEI